MREMDRSNEIIGLFGFAFLAYAALLFAYSAHASLENLFQGWVASGGLLLFIIGSLMLIMRKVESRPKLKRFMSQAFIALGFVVLATVPVLQAWETYIEFKTGKYANGEKGSLLTALYTIGLTLVTYLLVIVGYYQIQISRRNQRTAVSLQVCDKYDNDPILARDADYIYNFIMTERNRKQSEGEGYRALAETSGRNYRAGRCARRLLNYFDSIAIGTRQKLYDEDIVKEHLGGIFEGSLKRFAEARDYAPAIRDITREIRSDHGQLIRMLERWGGNIPDFAEK